MEKEVLRCAAVDDDPTMLEILKGFVQRQQESLQLVGTYNNYFDAATKITRLQPHIIFLDINMPGLNGLELLDVLQRKPFVIIVSADTRPKEALLTNPYIVDFLEKPVFYNRFVQAIEEVQELFEGKTGI